DRFGAVAEARHQRLSLRLEGASQVIAATPEWLDHLLGVLLDNACKYTPDGGAVDVRVAADGNRVTLTVEDSGNGIAPEARSRIFDRFQRATDQGAGAGLGLAIADAVVRATGGRWDFGVCTERAQLQQLAKVWEHAKHVAVSAATVALVAPLSSNPHIKESIEYDLGQATMSMMVAAADLGIGSGHAAVADQELARSL